MESFLTRYRNITVLLLVLCAQLVLLALQVKNDNDVAMIRVWTVTAVTPAARVLEGLRGGSIGFVRNYILLRDANDENKRLREEVGRLKIENNFLKTQLGTADRAQALAMFQARTASKTIAATVIGTGAASNSKMVFVDRGTVAGVQRGMAVVTPDGILGKVISSYPTASEVLLITDPDFAAGAISQKNQVRGTVKGQGSPLCRVDYVPVEEKVEVGEWFYTSGDDRVFPKGFPIGVVKAVRPGHPFQEILVDPAGLRHGLEAVLILLEGAHQAIPDTPPVATQVYLNPAPPSDNVAAVAGPPTAVNTEADKIRQRYQAIGDAQKHVYGDNPPGAKAIDFNAAASAGAAGQSAGPAASQSRPPAPAGQRAIPQPPTGGVSPPQGRPATSAPPARSPQSARQNTAAQQPRPPAPAAQRPAAENPSDPAAAARRMRQLDSQDGGAAPVRRPASPVPSTNPL